MTDALVTRGTRVQIVRGPFTGFDGTVLGVNRAGQTSILVLDGRENCYVPTTVLAFPGYFHVYAL